MKFCACAAAFWVALGSACAQAPVKPPIEAFATLPTVSAPSISPDGTHLALIQVRSGRPVASIWKLGATKPELVIPHDTGFIVGATWANDHRVLVTINLNARVYGEKVHPWYRTVSVDIATRDMAILFSDKGEARDYNYSASRIVDLAPGDLDHIYMPLFTGAGSLGGFYDQPRNTMYRVDVTNGKSQYVERGTKDTIDWVMDGSGNVVARQDQTDKPLIDHIYAYTPDKNWKEIAQTDASAGHGFDINGLSEDGKSLLITTTSDSDATQGLTALSLADGKGSDVYFNPKFDIDGALRDPWSGRVIGTELTMHLEHSIYFSPQLQDLQKNLEAAFPGTAVQARNWDLARKKVIVSVDGPVSPPTFYIFDTESHAVQRIARAYPQLGTGDLGEVRVYTYTARDGLEIPAYLTLPPGKDPKNLPVVILPHGGPMARDDMSFDWESQFLANRGYAVLRPNFRGSSGYGIKFQEAGYGQWGLKMQDDITDGVKKLIADGIADPKRICIAGGSYGGYAALAGAAFTPELYACAAAWAPVTDLRHFLATRSQDYGSDSAVISSWSHYIGNRSDDSEKLDAASPSENAAKIKCPILLMHGSDDATVRIDQSERMDRALRRKDKKVTFITIPKETHYMQTSDTRIRWLTELEKFLKDNIGD